MIWGYAHVWFSEFLSLDPEPQLARLKFVSKWGLRSTGLDCESLARLSDQELEALYRHTEENDLVANLTFQFGGFVESDDGVVAAPREAIARQRDAVIEVARRSASRLNSGVVSTEVGPAHRFLRRPNLQEQFELIARELEPLASELESMGLRLAVENHGDYYVSDIVRLCESVRNLWLFLDTGNTYLIGERPLEAVRTGAPYVAGVHFKDQTVRPRKDMNPINFEVAPAVTGEGDVPLREAYAILKEHAPDPERLMMEIELIPPRGVSAEEAMRRSVEFIRELEEEAGDE